MPENPALIVDPDWRTRQQGTMEQEYEIYVANARSLGWELKTFDEWLDS